MDKAVIDKTVIDKVQTATRLLDTVFAQWVEDHFAHDCNPADRKLIKRLAEAVSHAVNIKHTCVDLDIYSGLRDDALTDLLAGITADDIKRVLPEEGCFPLLRSADGKKIWLQKYHAFEYAVASALRVMHTEGRLDMIAGGPGTGKTYTAAVRIKNTLAENPACVIALAAPTGKAANNMMNALAQSGFQAEEYGLKGLTLHSLLQMNAQGPKPKRNSQHPLSCDLLVVDEASMIDLPMMYKLLQALPAHARLLLLGDKDQLASVEAGSVLGEIYAAFKTFSCVTELRESRRYQHSPEIGQLAEALNNGIASDMEKNHFVLRHTLDSNKPWHPGWLNGAKKIFASMPCEEEDKTIADVLFVQRQFQILCASREGPQGVAGINSMLEKALGKKNGSWYAGRPVMITSNDHARKLYNGDVGIVLPVSEDGRHITRAGVLKACFLVDGAIKTVSLAQMPPYETCYAITVHKSQGSEYDHVLIVLPADQQAVRNHPILTRELVYTAVTRARSRIDVWCGEGVLEAAASKVTQRMSGLSVFL